MALTRPRAHQLSGTSAKAAVRVVSESNVTLSGGAPATVDGVSLTLDDRILVTGQSTASQNGLYRCTVVGSGSNGTWVRSRDGSHDGTISAGMTTIVTEGSTYADTLWKLTTDGTITIGTTALAFSQHSGGGGTPGGSDTQVQFNDSDSFGGDAGLTYNKTTDSLTIVGTMQADLVKNREQRYTTSNMMKFNQLYTGAAAGSYFTQNEYQKIVTIIPASNSENYQVSGRILCQNAGEIQTINFKAALRSGDPLPDLSWSITYDQEHNGTAHFKPQLWTKETTTAGFVFAIQKISSGTLYGTVTVDLDIIPRTSSLLDNVTVNTTQDSEQTSIDAGYTANDMTLVKTVDGNDSGAITFNNAYKFPTSDGSANQVLQTDGSGALTFVDQSGGLSNIVEDTTPQLGGDLDLNSSDITGTGDINITGTGTFTGNVTAGNLVTSGTVTLDRLALTSSQTTVSPLHLTASTLNDGVGALRIDGAQADIFLNPSTATHTTVTFAVNDDQKLAFGMDNSSDFYITRRTGGAWYDDTLVIDRDTGDVALGYTLTVTGNATFGGDILNGQSDGVGNIGNSSVGFNTVHAIATSAQYADLAEKYTTDHDYEAGTVVVFGGNSEITQSTISHDRKVAGVISTNPAVKMNDGLDGQYLALQGRVPCKVIGPIEKGDLVVTSHVPGLGVKLDDTQYQPGCVIGKALESIEDQQEQVIEVVVGRL